MENLKVGDFVIVNEVDQPCSRLIAKVLKVHDDGAVDCQYCNIEYPIMHRVDTATRVETFGVTPMSFEHVFYVGSVRKSFWYVEGVQHKPSEARYSDGSLRNWQQATVFEIDDIIKENIKRASR